MLSFYSVCNFGVYLVPDIVFLCECFALVSPSFPLSFRTFSFVVFSAPTAFHLSRSFIWRFLGLCVVFLFWHLRGYCGFVTGQIVYLCIHSLCYLPVQTFYFASPWFMLLLSFPDVGVSLFSDVVFISGHYMLLGSTWFLVLYSYQDVYGSCDPPAVFLFRRCVDASLFPCVVFISTHFFWHLLGPSMLCPCANVCFHLPLDPDGVFKCRHLPGHILSSGCYRHMRTFFLSSPY